MAGLCFRTFPHAAYFGMADGDHEWRIGHETVGVYRECSCSQRRSGTCIHGLDNLK